nr:serine/threonine-protein phosphatase 7 long form homolog [Coffea arabica]XP_027087694.1 serine/threonine-protein phosphatase 7 long form homolog [Coffea arabica]
MGESTITLQDVEVLWGLRVDGRPVTLHHVRRTVQERKHLVNEVLGFWPEDAMLKGGRLKMSSMYRQLTTPVPPDAPDELVRQYARMYLLILLGGLLFADACGNVVSLNWLDYVRDLEAMGEYSWGSATLACLYSRLCHACRASTTTTGGPYLLLQIWAWERIPSIRPEMYPAPEIGEFPVAGRWVAERTGVDPPGRRSSYYREHIALLRMDEFIWMPYSDERLAALPRYCRHGERIWRARVPLVFWHIIEFHCPDRVMRQFGLVQNVPEPVNTNPQGLHQFDLSGYPGRNWAQFHSAWIQYWNARANAEVTGQLADTFRPSNDYLKWYHEHTILYISNPSDQNLQMGQMLQGVSGQFEYLVCIYLRLPSLGTIFGA